MIALSFQLLSGEEDPRHSAGSEPLALRERPPSVTQQPLQQADFAGTRTGRVAPWIGTSAAGARGQGGKWLP